MEDTNKKLYVGSLPYSTTEDELKELFSQFGQVISARVISDKFTGQSKGFGFVEMATDADAEKAINAANGAQFGGRTLVVNVARPPQERERRPFNENRGGGGNGGRSRRNG